MSHIVTIKTEIRDPVAIAAACERLQLTAPVQRTVRLFNAEATGLAVELPGWRYPIVCQTETGAILYDNYEGRWGSDAEFHRFKQAYAVELTKLQMRRQGQTPCEQMLEDGWIRVRAVVAA